MRGCWCQQKSFQGLQWTWVIPRPWWPTEPAELPLLYYRWQRKAGRHVADNPHRFRWNKLMDLAEAEISTFSGRLAHGQPSPTCHLTACQWSPSARGDCSPQGWPSRPRAPTDGQLGSSTPLRLSLPNRVFVTKVPQPQMIGFAIPVFSLGLLPTGSWNNSPYCAASVPALSIYFLLCWRTRTSPLFVFGQCRDLNLRREKRQI